MERGGEPVTRHPFDARGARLMVFALPCDAQRLQRLCDRTFAAPTEGAETYVPLGESVYVAFASIAELRSAEPPDDGLGSVAEREVAVWIPVYDTRRDRTAWVIPYIFVDAPAPLLGGREIYGFPKQPADVACRPNGSSFELRAHCVDRFAPTARVEQHTVLRATHPDGAVGGPSPDGGDTDLAGLLGEIAGWLGVEVDRPSRAGVRLLASWPVARCRSYCSSSSATRRSLPGLLPGRHRGRAAPVGPVRRRAARGRVGARRRRPGRAAARA